MLRLCRARPVNDYQELTGLNALLVFDRLIRGNPQGNQPVDQRTHARAANCAGNQSGERPQYQNWSDDGKNE